MGGAAARQAAHAARAADVASDQQTGGLQADVAIDRDTASRFGITAAGSTTHSTTRLASARSRPSSRSSTSTASILEVTRSFSRTRRRSTNSTCGPARAPGAAQRLRQARASNASLAVNHQGQFPAVTLSFNLRRASRWASGQGIQTAEREIGMPASVHGSFQGTAQAFALR